jgi:pantetheine-phosphate adenylyltransferase
VHATARVLRTLQRSIGVTVALFPGSFDPVTNGHIDTAVRASRIFDTVVMAVFDRPHKNLLFSTTERLELLREATRGYDSIRVETYSILTVNYARHIGASVIVRGLRDTIDFEHEFQIAQVNQAIDETIDIVFFMASRTFAHLSSSTVREIAGLGGDVSQFVPPHVAHALRRKFGGEG